MVDGEGDFYLDSKDSVSTGLQNELFLKVLFLKY